MAVDFGVWTEIFTYTYIAGVRWLLPIMLTLIACLLISRDMEKWKIMAFPLLVMQKLMGIDVHFILLSATAILFVIEALSTEFVGNILLASKKIVAEGTTQAKRKERKELQEMLDKIKKIRTEKKLEKLK